jgi:hypothetical protein
MEESMTHLTHDLVATRAAVRPKSRLTRALKLLPAVALVATVFVPAPPAAAQATRTWVSGVGDDANPCSRTAPCKTFAGAISKTATNGEINTLDPGGFGGVTITKSITINACTSNMGGVLVSGTNAIVVNALTTSNVTLRCLDINGLTTSLNAVRVLQAKTVKIVDSEIFGFTRNAIDIENSNANLKVHVARNFIHDNLGNGVLAAPTLSAANVTMTVKNNDIVDNGCGITAAQFGMDPAFNFGTNCGTRNSASGISTIAIINSFNNSIGNSTSVGVLSRGATGINRIGNNEITGNVFGLSSIDSGPILSFGGNIIQGNGTNGTPTGSGGSPVAP